MTVNFEMFASSSVSSDALWAVVGDLSLAYEGLELPGDPGQTLITFTAEPGSASAEALGFLASWASSTQAEVAHKAPSGT